MRVARRQIPVLLMALLIAVPALAQFGHPLKGTWSGDWGPTKENRTHVLLELNWDGKAITGTINPGPKAVALQKVDFDPPNWTVHFEADGKDATGKAIHYVVDGKVSNIGSQNRVLTGTWTQGGVKGDFKLTRN
jgi:hypothetical protein